MGPTATDISVEHSKSICLYDHKTFCLYDHQSFSILYKERKSIEYLSIVWKGCRFCKPGKSAAKPLKSFWSLSCFVDQSDLFIGSRRKLDCVVITLGLRYLYHQYSTARVTQARPIPTKITMNTPPVANFTILPALLAFDYLPHLKHKVNMFKYTLLFSIFKSF